VQGVAAIAAAVQEFQDAQEIRSGVPLGALVDDLSRGQFGGRMEAAEPVASAVMSLPSGEIRPQGQEWLRTLQAWISR